jgi:hypothetical protein
MAVVGALWSEQPYCFLLACACDHIRSVLNANPSLAKVEPSAAARSGDPRQVSALGKLGLLQLVSLSHGP